MSFAVEVKLVDRPDEWQQMRHKFETEQQADTIRRAALGASDCVDARVVRLRENAPSSVTSSRDEKVPTQPPVTPTEKAGER